MWQGDHIITSVSGLLSSSSSLLTHSAYPLPYIYYSTGARMIRTVIDPYLTWLNYLLDQTSIAQTLVKSYGPLENDIPRDCGEPVLTIIAAWRRPRRRPLRKQWPRDCLIRDGFRGAHVQLAPEFSASWRVALSFLHVRPQISLEVY